MSRYQEEMHTLSGDTARKALKASGLRLKSIVGGSEAAATVNPAMPAPIKEESSELLPQASRLSQAVGGSDEHLRLRLLAAVPPPAHVVGGGGLVRAKPPTRDYSATPDRLSDRMRIRRMACSLLSTNKPTPSPPPPRPRGGVRPPPPLAPLTAAAGRGQPQLPRRPSSARAASMGRWSGAAAPAPPPRLITASALDMPLVKEARPPLPRARSSLQ